MNERRDHYLLRMWFSYRRILSKMDSKSGFGVSATIAVVQIGVFIYDVLTYPIYTLLQRPWTNLAKSKRKRVRVKEVIFELIIIFGFFVPSYFMNHLNKPRGEEWNNSPQSVQSSCERLICLKILLRYHDHHRLPSFFSRPESRRKTKKASRIAAGST